MHSEERWCRGWLWFLAAYSLITFCLPYVSFIQIAGDPGDLTVNWFPADQLSPLGLAKMCLPAVFCAIAVIATRLGWLGRALILSLALVLGPVVEVIHYIERFGTTAVLEGARVVVTGIAIAIIPTVAHARRRNLANRSYRLMSVGAVLLIVSLTQRLVSGTGLGAGVRHAFASGDDWYMCEVVVEVAMYLAYLVVALVTGLRGWDAGRRAISIASRLVFVGLIVYCIPAGWWVGASFGRVVAESFMALREGGIMAAEAGLGALAVSCFFQSRVTLPAAVEAFD